MNKIINNLKTTLSSLFQNIKRKKYLQGLIGKYGQIIEKNDKSNTPWCVSPSFPTIPALSTHITTPKFCIHTSWITWSKLL